jgi:hypothetical protein
MGFMILLNIHVQCIGQVLIKHSTIIDHVGLKLVIMNFRGMSNPLECEKIKFIVKFQLMN